MLNTLSAEELFQVWCCKNTAHIIFLQANYYGAKSFFTNMAWLPDSRGFINSFTETWETRRGMCTVNAVGIFGKKQRALFVWSSMELGWNSNFTTCYTVFFSKFFQLSYRVLFFWFVEVITQMIPTLVELWALNESTHPKAQLNFGTKFSQNAFLASSHSHGIQTPELSYALGSLFCISRGKAKTYRTLTKVKPCYCFNAA